MFVSARRYPRIIWRGNFDTFLYLGADHSQYLTSFNSAPTEARKDKYSLHTYPLFSMFKQQDYFIFNIQTWSISLHLYHIYPDVIVFLKPVIIYFQNQ